jgi:N-acetylneuraminic acid mutarotase
VWLAENLLRLRLDFAANYTIIYLLLLVEINCQMNPTLRRGHTATLIDGKLYILGGLSILEGPTVMDFFYLDFSVKFDTQNLLWQDLSSINTVPPHYGAASVEGGANNNTLFLYGGETLYSPTHPSEPLTSLVYIFNPQDKLWTIPIITRDSIRKSGLKGIINNNGKMYLWGGEEVRSDREVNDMLILDTINLSWGIGSLVGAPTPRGYHGAVLLPSRKIIYFGK